jgi:phosphate-selective porin OprO/OprP
MALSASPAPATDSGQLPYADFERRLLALESRQQAEDQPDEEEVRYPTFRVRGWIAAEQLMVEDTPLSGPLENFSGFRSIRLGADGFIAENLRYVSELEVASNQGVINNTVNPFDSIRLKDVFVEFQQLPWVGYFRVGHFKEPMGLEELIRDRFKVFVDRSTVTAVFAPKRNFGAMIYDSIGEGEFLSWFIGVFNADSTEDEMGYQGDSNDLALTMRTAWLPYFDDAAPGRYLVHMGGAVSARRTVNPVVDNGNFQPTIELGRYRSGLIAVLNDGEEFMLYNTELAWAHGPFAAQHEFFILNTSNQSGVVFWGSYLELSYFLTGENRSYNKLDKVFDRTFPYQNFMAIRTGEGICRGWGAWQISGRASYVDLDTNGQLQPGAVLGTQLNLSANLHWYLNPYCHLVTTYVHPIATPAAGGTASTANDFGIRFQVDW